MSRDNLFDDEVIRPSVYSVGQPYQFICGGFQQSQKLYFTASSVPGLRTKLPSLDRSDDN